ncbi:MAG: nucleotidyltransferase domain-containing protein [Clostridiales bacterium]|nr:nucleotidyltransferase domain-containing protein [Clostridiales bacterium]MCF8023731.1 nucleotidyltransferase domain-containing protein [Clostridiales bacterium]
MARTAFEKEQNKKFMHPGDKIKIQNKLDNIIENDAAISFAYIHGSFLTEEYFNDIDIAVYLKENYAVSKKQALSCEITLEETLHNRLGLPLDVRAINYAPLSFCYNVIKNGQLLCAKDEDLKIYFVTRTIDNYLDFLPYRKRYLKEVLGLEI